MIFRLWFMAFLLLLQWLQSLRSAQLFACKVQNPRINGIRDPHPGLT